MYYGEKLRMHSKELDKVLRDAWMLASASRHAYVTIEHLLHAICLDENGLAVLRATGADPTVLITELESWYKDMEPLRDDAEPLHTVSFRRIIQHCLMHAHSAEQKKVGVGDILISLFIEEESHAVYFLRKQGVERLDVMNFAAHGIRKDADDVDLESLLADDEFWDEIEAHTEGNAGDGFDTDDADETDSEFDDLDAPPERKRKKGKRSALAKYTEDWTEMARNGAFDKLVGRTHEVERTIEILSRRLKNNPVLVGDPGVGKTAIVMGLAQQLVRDEVPERLRGYRLISLDLGSLLAGTRFRGDFEERLKFVLREIKDEKNIILFIDEIHNLIGAGAAGNSVMDASNLLKPALQSGQLRCIGATTYEEHKNHFEKDRALSRRFQKVDVTEPSIDDAIRILSGLQPDFEAYHKLKYQPSAVEAAVRLSARYLNDRQLPDKAIDVMDEAGARVSLKSTKRKQVTIRDIEELVAGIARIPIQALSSGDKESLRDMETVLNSAVFGQQKAIHAITAAVKRHRAGLGDPQKPVGSFLFSGPTGVGKTELCRVLAKTLGVELLRFDMSEYMEKHTVSRLIGAPAGYVGFEQGGLLTDAIRRNPNCVLLLDEIEKAHADIYNVLLQIMDYATLTDNAGRKADFRNVMLVMTSNVGSREMSRSGIGFADVSRGAITGGDPNASIRQHFTPEFRNRLDEVVIFGHLDQATITRIVDKFIGELNTQLGEKKVSLKLTETARSWLAEKGYSPAYGARPMARVIQEHIKNRLVDEMLFGRLQKGGSALVDVDMQVDTDVDMQVDTDVDVNSSGNANSGLHVKKRSKTHEKTAESPLTFTFSGES
jgi:ATP-dependent Clp protease ATP-binding subunit ClpA